MEYTSPPSVTASVTTVSAAVNNAYKTAIDQIGIAALYHAARQGAAADWSDGAANNYSDIANVKLQTGVYAFTSGAIRTITFPEVFTEKPTVLVGAYSNYGGAGAYGILLVEGITVSAFTLQAIIAVGSGNFTADVPWFAIGV